MQLFHYFSTIPTNTYKEIGTFLLSSAAISVLLQTIKKKYGVTDSRIIISILGSMSFVVSLASDFLSKVAQNPTLLGDHTLEVMSIATIIYHFSVSPIYKRIVQLLEDANTYLETGDLTGKSKS